MEYSSSMIAFLKKKQDCASISFMSIDKSSVSPELHTRVIHNHRKNVATYSSASAIADALCAAPGSPFLLPLPARAASTR